jgi:cytochrome oxidase Cu insertion factor (SCO1/SenC/PrrC family)
MKFSLSPRLALLIIAAMFLLPLLLAWLMYSGSLDFKPTSTRNLGTLIEPPVPIDWTVTILLPGEANLAAGRDQGSVVFSEHWVILQPVPAGCDDPCLKEVSNLRQIHRASGRQQFRIRLALLLDESSPSDQAQTLLAIYPKFHLITDPSGLLSEALAGIQQNLSGQAGPAKGVYMIDPLGNIMMYYQAGSDPNYIKQDMKRLLTWSKLDKQ